MESGVLRHYAPQLATLQQPPFPNNASRGPEVRAPPTRALTSSRSSRLLLGGGGLPLSGRRRCGELQPQGGLLRFRETGSYIVPVPDVPDRLEVLRLLVVILEVVGVLPRIEDHEGHASDQRLALMVVDLRSQQPRGDRIPHQRAPTRPHTGRGGLRELLPERVESAEVPIDRLRELAFGLSASVRR